MMHQSGIVISVSGSNATVRFQRSSACGKCGACMTAGNNNMEIIVRNTLGAKEGDLVSIEIEKKGFFEAGFLMYILPLAALLLGLFISSGLKASEPIMAVSAITSCAVVFIILRALEPSFKKNARFLPKMIDVIKQG